MEKVINIIKTLRIKRWYINGFVLAGGGIAAYATGEALEIRLGVLITATILACLLSSAQYALNEVFDAETDAQHPEKKHRLIPAGALSKNTVFVVAIGIYAVVIIAASRTGEPYFLASILTLVLSGFAYNVPPLRFKNVAYLDFISEAINNPIRFAIGWFAVTTAPLPASIFIALWAFAAFLMAAKRFAEFRFIGDKVQAAQYRKSFSQYTEARLQSAMLTAACIFMFMLGVITIRYEKNLILAFPLYALFMSWLHTIAHQRRSFINEPEHIFSNRGFLVYLILLVVISMLLPLYPRAIINF